MTAPSDWDDWRWQMANRLSTPDQLGRHVELTDDERRAIDAVGERFVVAVTPYYMSLIDPHDPRDPVRRQAIPRLAELVTVAGEREDPLAEAAHMPVPGLVHRYPDRALLYLSHNCAVYCRHCFRRGKVGHPDSAPTANELERALTYLRDHPQIRDLLLSGGDPLSLGDNRLAALFSQLRQIGHLDIVRLATRMPVTLPQRITPQLVECLRRFQPIYVNTHFNHPRECTPEAALALGRLADSGFVLGNQMVLLAGVNDQPEVVRELNRWLLKHRCRPYYMHQCDAVPGLSHFRTPVSSGLRIVGALRGWTSGLGVPHYALDLPGGGGKVALAPDPVVKKHGSQLTLRSYDGHVFDYREGDGDG